MNKELIVSTWKNLAANKQNSRRHHVQYCILRAMMAKGEDKVAITKHLLRKAFPPVTKTMKLANGRKPFDTLEGILCRLTWHEKDHPLQAYANGQLTQGIELTDEEREQYASIIKGLNTDGRFGLIRRYSYFFTRQDIFDEYQLVQTAHVALELGSKLTPEQVKDLHFTCCGVADVDELEAVERVLQTMKLDYVVFREPDIGNQKTAIGVYPVEEHRRGILRGYNLLRFNRGLKVVDAELVEFEAA